LGYAQVFSSTQTWIRKYTKTKYLKSCEDNFFEVFLDSYTIS
jgi:hypothetical protein